MRRGKDFRPNDQTSELPEKLNAGELRFKLFLCRHPSEKASSNDDLVDSENCSIGYFPSLSSGGATTRCLISEKPERKLLFV